MGLARQAWAMIRFRQSRGGVQAQNRLQWLKKDSIRRVALTGYCLAGKQPMGQGRVLQGAVACAVASECASRGSCGTTGVCSRGPGSDYLTEDGAEDTHPFHRHEPEGWKGWNC
jgi:hypothetical protein